MRACESKEGRVRDVRYEDGDACVDASGEDGKLHYIKTSLHSHTKPCKSIMYSNTSRQLTLFTLYTLTFMVHRRDSGADGCFGQFAPYDDATIASYTTRNSLSSS